MGTDRAVVIEEKPLYTGSSFATYISFPSGWALPGRLWFLSDACLQIKPRSSYNQSCMTHQKGRVGEQAKKNPRSGRATIQDAS